MPLVCLSQILVAVQVTTVESRPHEATRKVFGVASRAFSICEPKFPKINPFSQLGELWFFVGTLQMGRNGLESAKRIADVKEAVDLFVNRFGNSRGS